jgi:hypothetical protein
MDPPSYPLAQHLTSKRNATDPREPRSPAQLCATSNGPQSIYRPQPSTPPAPPPNVSRLQWGCRLYIGLRRQDACLPPQDDAWLLPDAPAEPFRKPLPNLKTISPIRRICPSPIPAIRQTEKSPAEEIKPPKIVMYSSRHSALRGLRLSLTRKEPARWPLQPLFFSRTDEIETVPSTPSA